MSSTDIDLSAIQAFAITLAKKAGATIVAGSPLSGGLGGGFDEKKNTADLVTETDQATEKLVKEEIAAAYPDHRFIGEESWAAGEENQLTDEPTWIVDPIDGTTNFVHGFPYTCISIGFCYKREPVIGVIYAPFLEHLYTGVRGGGSYVSTPQHPSPRRLPLSAPTALPSLAQALIAFEWGSDRSPAVMAAKLATFGALTAAPPNGGMAQGVRSIGSAALNFANVAAGALDLYWEIGCWAWDVCAGIVIAREAGALVVGSKANHDKEFTADTLTGRKYLVVRAIKDTEQESSLQAQKRIVASFYEKVTEWEA